MSPDLALLLALLAGLLAAAWLLNKPPRPPSGPRTGGVGPVGGLAVLLLLGSCATGCVSPLNTAKLVVGSAADLYNAAQPRLEAREKVELEACLAPTTEPATRPACVERVILAWAPVKAALVALDGALDAARLGLLVAAGREAVGAAYDSGEVQRLVGDVLAAVLELRKLTAPKPVAPLLVPSALPAKGGAS